jgi:hypothetical protein
MLQLPNLFHEIKAIIADDDVDNETIEALKIELKKKESAETAVPRSAINETNVVPNEVVYSSISEAKAAADEQGIKSYRIEPVEDEGGDETGEYRLSKKYDAMSKSELIDESMKGNNDPEFHMAMYDAGFSDEEVGIAIDAGYRNLRTNVSEEPFATENLANELGVGILGSEPVDSAANDYNIVSTNTMSSSDRMLEQRGVQDQKTIVIPIVMPQKRRQSVTPVPEPLGLSSKSTSEAANPTISTRDSFISGTLDARS